MTSVNATIAGWFSKTGDRTIALLVFVVTLLVFIFSPSRQFSDSQFTILLSESLLKHHSFWLDGYLPEEALEKDYRFERVRGHTYYWPSPGPSILSIPFVAAAN